MASLVEAAGPASHVPFSMALENVRGLPAFRFVALATLIGFISYVHVARMWKYYHIKRTLTIHIIVGLVELFKFSFEDIFRNPLPGWFDFAVTLYQSKNALSIIASLRKGDRKWSRPIFHAAVLLRIALSGYSVVAQSTSAYRVSIALDHGFIWDRLMLWAFMRVLPKYSTSYLLAQYLGALVSFETNSVEGGFMPLGGISLVFTVMMVGFRLFDEWNIIDMSVFEEKQAVDAASSSTPAPAAVEAAPVPAAEAGPAPADTVNVFERSFQTEVPVSAQLQQTTAPRLQVITDPSGLSTIDEELATPTLESASSSSSTTAFSDGSMSPVSSIGSPLLTPQTPAVYSVPVADPFSAPSQEAKLRKMQEMNGFTDGMPVLVATVPETSGLEGELRVMPGGDASLWQPSKQDLKTTANALGQAFCKFAAQSGFTSLDHYETLKKRKFTINNLEA